MAFRKVHPLVVLVLLCAGVGVQSQGLTDLLGVLDVLPEQCKMPVTRMAVSCLGEIGTILEDFFDLSGGIADIGELDLESDKFKEQLEEFAEAKIEEFSIGEKCCESFTALEEKKCGCEEKIDELAEFFGGNLLTELVTKIIGSCDPKVELSLRTVPDSCPKPKGSKKSKKKGD
ncbi:hypothetical protein BSKO_07125 [Bryopsis sp. KO-2023]|nr:hypothetical protein BSKO_07125 [Bryopsis sp. KO-2023]